MYQNWSRAEEIRFIAAYGAPWVCILLVVGKWACLMAVQATTSKLAPKVKLHNPYPVLDKLRLSAHSRV